MVIHFYHRQKKAKMQLFFTQNFYIKNFLFLVFLIIIFHLKFFTGAVPIFAGFMFPFYALLLGSLINRK